MTTSAIGGSNWTPPIPNLPVVPPASTILTGLDHFFRLAPVLPSVEARVKAVLAQIDWSSDTIMIVVPGSSEYWIKDSMSDAVKRAMPNQRLVMIPYQANWQFAQSVPDGMAVLKGVLEEIHRRKPRAKVLLTGESQGAWVIGNTLRDPALNKIVTRVALWGHPGAADAYPGHKDHGGAEPVLSADGKVREYNNPSDIVSTPLGGNPKKIMKAVEGLARMEFGGPLLEILGFAAMNPGMLVGLLRSQLHRIPGFQNVSDPHTYATDMEKGVAFLRDGRTSA